MKSATFGQISVWVLQVTVLYYVTQATLEPRPALHAFSMTALLPEWLWQSSALFFALKCIIIASLLCWAAHLCMPLAPLLAAGGVLLLISNAVAGQIYARHQPYVSAVLLGIYAVWSLTRRADIATAQSLWVVGKSAQYPRWVYNLSLLYLASTYSFAGISKLLASGVGWANGVSLQLWCWSGSDGLIPARSICLYDRWLAFGAQITVLVAEVSCILCVFLPRLRRVYGIALIGFHLCVEVLFGFKFYGNILAVGFFFVLYPVWNKEDSTIRSSQATGISAK